MTDEMSDEGDRGLRRDDAIPDHRRERGERDLR